MKISEEIRTFSIIPQVKLPDFVDGDPLCIEGEGTEAGQEMSYITADSYNPGIDNNSGGEADAFKDEDYKYEIFTRIEGGSKFYFRSQPSNTIYTLSADGTKIQAIETEEQAQAPISETGIYRIRFNGHLGGGLCSFGRQSRTLLLLDLRGDRNDLRRKGCMGDPRNAHQTPGDQLGI